MASWQVVNIEFIQTSLNGGIPGSVIRQQMVEHSVYTIRSSNKQNRKNNRLFFYTYKTKKNVTQDKMETV